MRSAGVALVLALLLLFCYAAAGAEPLWTERVNDEYITSIAVSEDGSRVVLGTSMGGVYLYEGDGTLCWSARHKGTMRVEIAPDASLVVAGESESREKDKGALRAYDQNGTLAWMKHTGWICGFDTSEDLGRIAVGNRLGQIAVYDRGGFDEAWEDNLLKRYYATSAAGLSPDGRILAYSLLEHTPAIYLLNVDTWARRTIKSVFREHGSAVHTLRLSGNGTYLLAASGEGSTDTVYLFTDRGALKWKETVPDILDMEISSDGELILLGSEDGRIRAYNHAGDLAWARCMEGAVQSLSLTPQGDLIAAGSRCGEILLLSGTGEPRWEYRVVRFPAASIDAVELSCQGDALVGVVNGNEVLFFSTAPEPVAPLPTLDNQPVEPLPEQEVTACELPVLPPVRGDVPFGKIVYREWGSILRSVFQADR